MIISCCRKLLCVLILACLAGAVHAQQPDSAGAAGRSDNFMHKVREFGKEETVSSIEKYKNGRIGIRQEQLLQVLRQTSERAKIFLRKGMDTSALRKVLTEAYAQIDLVRDGIFIHHDTEHSTRNLAVSAAVLDELLVKITERRAALAAQVKTQIDFVDRIDSLSADPALYTFPFDSVHTVRYVQKIAVVAKELGPTDTALRKSVTALRQLQTDVDLVVFNIRSNQEDIDQLRNAQVAKTFVQEFPFLWEPPAQHRPFGETARLSLAKEKLALTYYLRDSRGRLLVLLVLIIASWYFLRSLKLKWREEKGAGADFDGKLVVRYPILSAMIIVLSVFQFIFLQPPFIFSFCIWLVGAICLCFVFHRYISPFWMRFWLIMTGFFILAGGTNLLLQVSTVERWWMLLLSLTGAGYCIYVLRSDRRNELRERKILYFIAFVAVMETASAIFNLFGRYNLSKTLLVIGFSGLVIAILFLWTVRLINEGLGLISTIFKHPDRKLFYIDFERIGEKAPRFLYVFLVVGWFILVGRNFYAFQEAAAPFNEFLNTERTVGNYTFTINSIFIFVLIIAISAVLSQIISFFAGDPGDAQNRNKSGRQPGFGRWLLLIRIFILSLGLFLAFAAAGIPLDKLAIVLGALGIGIGLGLQGLVNNLVSGLIIAFEKPVNVGDIIELNGQRGTMKSIGFRSSVVSLIDGACLVIPNGDLLSNHLVNWTMGNNRRRLNVVIGVAYGSDLKKIKTLLETILHENDNVLKYPEPIVSIKGYEDSSIDFDLYFWVAHIRNYLLLRSEVLALVDEAFRKEGIVIPFPQRDLHIFTDKDKPGTE